MNLQRKKNRLGMSLNIGKTDKERCRKGNIMGNMELYEKVRNVPSEAQTPITAGRLKGMTDINPMWRIKTLTEQFGACGVGWYYEIVREWTDAVNDEMVASVEINLYVKIDNEWSKPISGIGGSKIASKESRGIYVDDEAYKKASTDAISVACKNLGIGADVYWNKDSDKYNDPKKDNFNKGESTSNFNKSSDSNRSEQADALSKKIAEFAKEHNMTLKEIAKDYKLTNTTGTPERLQEVLDDLTGKFKEEPIDDFASIDEQVPF